jgi:hypothetical protein
VGLQKKKWKTKIVLGDFEQLMTARMFIGFKLDSVVANLNDTYLLERIGFNT